LNTDKHGFLKAFSVRIRVHAKRHGNSQRAKKHGCRFIGVDISKKMLACSLFNDAAARQLLAKFAWWRVMPRKTAKTWNLSSLSAKRAGSSAGRGRKHVARQEMANPTPKNTG
jgi:hypothetical protein